MYIYSRQFHRDAYFITLIIMIASIPLWRYAMSVMQFTLLGLWIWAGFSFKHSFWLLGDNNLFRGIGRFLVYMTRLTARNFVGKFRIFFRNKAAMVLVSLFFIHVIGLIGTTDFAYSMKDLRTKLPLLALPIILLSMEKISRQRFYIIMLAHAGAVFVGTLISSWRLLGGEFNDIREIVFNISHIRFSLNLCIAVFSLIYFIYLKNYFKVWTKLIFALGALWLISFLIILESGIGLINLLTICRRNRQRRERLRFLIRISQGKLAEFCHGCHDFICRRIINRWQRQKQAASFKLAVVHHDLFRILESVKIDVKIEISDGILNIKLRQHNPHLLEHGRFGDKFGIQWRIVVQLGNGFVIAKSLFIVNLDAQSGLLLVVSKFIGVTDL